jgi:ABC-type uncharacterized transport system substrate-binding protein
VFDMRRRDFITLLSGAVVAWPLAAGAQQGERVRRIGVLLPATSDDAEFQARVGAFLQELSLLGWAIGRNVRIDTRWTAANADQTRRHAAELAALAPDVILAFGSSTVGPMMQASRNVPIVFPGTADPVGSGFVDSLARPGGNATGRVAARGARAAGGKAADHRVHGLDHSYGPERIGPCFRSVPARTRLDRRSHRRN